jgi:hypothetical protein
MRLLTAAEQVPPHTPLRQVAVDLHFLQILSPAHALENLRRHIRHVRILRSGSGFGM